MSVLDNLNRIKSCKDDIKQALTDRGVDMTNVAFTEYATKINEIPSGGGDYLDMRMNMSTYYSTAESVPEYVFYNMSGLQTVNLPNCSYVGSNAFQRCISLQSVNLPNCGKLAFSAFQQCSSLQSIDLPNCVDLGEKGFINCTSLQTANLPICSYVQLSAFERCTSLQSVNIPMCERVESCVFYDCSSLTSIDLPICRLVGASVFQNCTSLQTVNIPMCSVIGISTFYTCSSLSVLDLRSTYSCSLSNSYIFFKTPFASGIGSIYVHNTVLSQFQNATNWTYFSNCFVGVGDTDKPLLSFDSGRVYGDTYYMFSNFKSYLGITNSSITSIDLPNLNRFFSSVYFSNCSNLTSVNLPVCVSVSNSVFYSCSSLQTVNIPMCEYVGSSAFNGCKSLQSIDLPLCSYVGSNTFQYCSSLQTANLPMCEYVGSFAFQQCSSLQTIYLPKCSFIEYDGIALVPNIKEIYIGTSISAVCVIRNNNAFLTYNPSIFVPMSLVDAYKSANHWSEHASQIFGI